MRVNAGRINLLDPGSNPGASTTPSPARWKNQIIAGLYTTDPPLALSHLRLRRVPPTAINVHRRLGSSGTPRRELSRKGVGSNPQTGSARATRS